MITQHDRGMIVIVVIVIWIVVLDHIVCKAQRARASANQQRRATMNHRFNMRL